MEVFIVMEYLSNDRSRIIQIFKNLEDAKLLRDSFKKSIDSFYDIETYIVD